MAEKTLIIHGWSDVSKSFLGLKKFLIDNKFNADDIFFVDYESQEDDMTYNDVSDGLRDRLIELKLIDENDEALNGDTFNVIVHSTGGLVVRHWLTTYYSGVDSNTQKKKICPVKRIVMLAPANFGSPLAKNGKSFLGALVAGRKDTELADFLEVGQQILDGLELGSSFQWKLAHKDLLSPIDFYSAKAIHTTVLVGIEDYKDFLRSFVNKPGTDGTVVISGSQLDSVKFSLNFKNAKYGWSETQTISSIAFGVLEKVNHSSIVSDISKPGSVVAAKILQALKTNTEADFIAHQTDLSKVTNQTYANTKQPRYEQFLIHAVDEFGSSLPDFMLEFFVCKRSDIKTPDPKSGLTAWLTGFGGKGTQAKFSKKLSDIISCEFESFSKDKSYRRFLVDVDILRSTLVKAAKELKEEVVLCMKIWVPPVGKTIQFSVEELKSLVIYDSTLADNPIEEYTAKEEDKDKQGKRPALFYPNTTTLIELQVNRYNNYVWVDSAPMSKKEKQLKIAKQNAET